MKKNADLDVTVLDMLRAEAKSRPVTISYQKEPGGKVEVRTVEITDMYTWGDEGYYYITGWCRTRGARRTFRMDRVTHYTVHRGGAFCGAHVAFLAGEGREGGTPIPPYTQYAAEGTTPADVADGYATYADYMESRGCQEEADQAWVLADLLWAIW